MIIDFKYRDFDSEIALYFYKKECKYDNFYWDEYIISLSEEQFWWFLSSVIN